MATKNGNGHAGGPVINHEGIGYLERACLRAAEVSPKLEQKQAFTLLGIAVGTGLTRDRGWFDAYEHACNKANEAARAKRRTKT